MRDSDADIAIDVLNKLIDQELKAASAGMRDGNRILEEGARRCRGGAGCSEPVPVSA